MTIKHHPAPENLLSCAAGSMPEAPAAVMACHMSMCPYCQKELSFLTSVGAVLFEAMQPETLAKEAPFPKNERQRPQIAALKLIKSDVPAPLQKYVGTWLKEIKWRRVALEIWQYPIPLSEHSTASLKLMKILPGRAIPGHCQSGSELALVLQGSFKDDLGTYEVGDVAVAPESAEHLLVAAGEVDCVCLIATDNPIRF